MNSVRGRESGDNYAKKRRLMKLSALEELNHTTKKQKQLDSQLEDEISSDDDHEESDNGETETENEYDSEESESEYEEGQANFEDEEDQADLEGEQYQAELEKMNTEGRARKVRGPTKMKQLWKEHDDNNKIQLKFNKYGQPCGLKTCKLTSFIGYLVRGKEVSLAARNWSKVDKNAKEKLWLTVQGFFSINDCYKPWVLRSASKKWKDFKAVLKKKFYNPQLSKRKNILNGCAARIPGPQWVWLVNHWKSSNAQLKSEKNKDIRAQQLNASHTTGSRSYAVVLDQLEIKEGREDEIKKRFQEDPSLITEEARDNDLYSELFPKERSTRRRGLGLLVNGVATERVFEALAEVVEVRQENKKLWSVVDTLMTNQAKLQQQYDELKSQISAPQRFPSVDSSPIVGPVPQDPLRDVANQEASVTHERPEPEEQMGVVSPNLNRIKSRISEHQTTKDKTPPQQSVEKAKKQRRFRTPLHMANEDARKDMKCGMEVGLISPNSKMMVALGTIQTTDRNAKASDGKPLADCVEVLVSIVFNQTTLLPCVQGKICKLGSATARCIPWPRQNIICSDGTSLHSKVTSAISHISLNRKDNGGSKTSKSKAEATKCHGTNGSSQDVVADKIVEKVSKEKSKKGEKMAFAAPEKEMLCRKRSKLKGRSSSQLNEESTSKYYMSEHK